MNALFLRINTMFSKGNLVRNVALLVGGNVMGQGLLIIASPLITRLYSPDDFGTLTLYTTLLSLISMVVALRYDLAIPLPVEDQSAANLLALAIMILTGVSACTGVGIYFFADEVADLVNAPYLAAYLWLLPFSLFGVGVYQTLNFWALRKQAYPEIAKTKLSQSISLISLQLLFGWLQFKPLGLLLGDVAGRMGGSGSLCALVWRKDRAVLKGVTWAGIRREAKRYRRFPLISSWGTLVQSAVLQCPPLILAFYYETEVVGWFGIGERVIGLPMTMLGASISQVLLIELATLAKTEPERLPALFWKILKIMLGIGLLVVAPVVLVAPWLFSYAFGDEWGQSGLYLQILSVSIILQFAASPLRWFLEVLERQDLFMSREIVKALLMVGVTILIHMTNCQAVTAIVLFSVAISMGHAYGIFLGWKAITSARFQSRMREEQG